MNRILTAPLLVSVPLLMLSLTSTSGFAQQVPPSGGNPTNTSPERSPEEIERIWQKIRPGLPDPAPTTPENSTVIINQPTKSVPQSRTCESFLSDSQIGSAAAMGVDQEVLSDLRTCN